MQEETFKVAQKVHDDILFFREGKRKLQEHITMPMPECVRTYLIECVNDKILELENEFRQL